MTMKKKYHLNIKHKLSEVTYLNDTLKKDSYTDNEVTVL